MRLQGALARGSDSDFHTCQDLLLLLLLLLLVVVGVCFTMTCATC